MSKDNPNFQERVYGWAVCCFGKEDAENKRMRSLRFIEEALELVQATGLLETDVDQVLEYVYRRKKGEIKQEVGGTMVTLATLCQAQNVDLEKAAEEELCRVWQKRDEIRQRHMNKPKFEPNEQFPSATRCACGAVLILKSEKDSGHCSECIRMRS